jgi:hypothetical protein
VFHGWRWTIVLINIYFMNLTAQKRSHNCTRAGERCTGVPRGGGGPLFYLLFTPWIKLVRSRATIAPEPEKDALVFHGWRWTTVLLNIYFMNLTAQKRSNNCTRAGEGCTGVPQGGGGPLFYLLFTP